MKEGDKRKEGKGQGRKRNTKERKRKADWGGCLKTGIPRASFCGRGVGKGQRKFPLVLVPT